MKENTIASNFDPHECVIFVQSTKIGTHENKDIHNRLTTNGQDNWNIRYQHQTIQAETWKSDFEMEQKTMTLLSRCI